MFEYEVKTRRRPPRPQAIVQSHKRSSDSRRARATVVTVLEAKLRPSIDDATASTFSNVHADSVSEAAMAVSEHVPRALLLSTALVEHDALPQIARLVMKNPGVLPVAVACSDKAPPADVLLGLGACGVRRFLDLNGRSGWERLRGLLDDGGGEIEGEILQTLLPRLEGASDEFRHFLAALVRRAPETTSVRCLSKFIGVRASTLMSRFFRASLPSPKSYLSMTRLLYAAAYFEKQGVSVADVSNSLNFSSPQSFGRHVRMVLRLTASEFRRQLSFAAAIEHFAERLIAPHQPALATFRPLDLTTSALGVRRTEFRAPL